MRDAKVFSKIDANVGLHQIVLDDESSLPTILSTPLGRYCYKRLPFGVNSRPEHFQRKGVETLEGLERSVCLMDDIEVYGLTRSQHGKRLETTLARLEAAGLTLSKESIKFLSQIISSAGVEPDPDKVQAIVHLPEPEDVSALRRFQGMVKQLGKLIPNLAEETKPLGGLLSTKSERLWDTAQTKAFKRVKTLISSAPTLKFYDPQHETKVTADASYGLGAMLSQKKGDVWKPTAFAS